MSDTAILRFPLPDCCENCFVRHADFCLNPNGIQRIFPALMRERRMNDCPLEVEPR